MRLTYQARLGRMNLIWPKYVTAASPNNHLNSVPAVGGGIMPKFPRERYLKLTHPERTVRMGQGLMELLPPLEDIRPYTRGRRAIIRQA